MDDMEKEPGEPVAGESRPENWVEPSTNTEPDLEVVESDTRFAESAEMTALRNQIEQSQEFNPELGAAYYEAGLAIADADGGSSLGKVEFQLAYAELKIKAGYKDEAWEDLGQLSETAEFNDNPSFSDRVRDAIRRTN